jgi:hypothetical protein
MLFDEHAFDVITGGEEETFDPADVSLLDSGGTYTLVKGVTTASTELPALRIYSTIESLGSNKSVERSSTEADLYNDDQPDIEHEDLDSRALSVSRSTSGIKLTRRSGCRVFPLQKARDRGDLESQGYKIANKSTGGRKAITAIESALLSDVNTLLERAYIAFTATVDFTTITTTKTPQSYAES